jgi:hypothetical protein
MRWHMPEGGSRPTASCGLRMHPRRLGTHFGLALRERAEMAGATIGKASGRSEQSAGAGERRSGSVSHDE